MLTMLESLGLSASGFLGMHENLNFLNPCYHLLIIEGPQYPLRSSPSKSLDSYYSSSQDFDEDFREWHDNKDF